MIYTPTGAASPDSPDRCCPLCGCFYVGRCDCAEPRALAPTEPAHAGSLADEVLREFWRDSKSRRK